MYRSASETLGFIKPEFPTLVPEPPTGEGWIHEIKYDGYRTLIVVDRGHVPGSRLDQPRLVGEREHRGLAARGQGPQKAPRQLFASGVRAVETITASRSWVLMLHLPPAR